MPTLKKSRHEKFALALFKGMSQRDAAIEAGYKSSRAKETGYRLVTYGHIFDRIQELHKEAAADGIMPVRERKERLSEIGRARLTDFVEDGEPILNSDIPNSGAAAEFYKRQSYNREGEVVITKSIKLHNPMSAMDLLNKMEGSYGNQPPAGGIVQNFVFLLPDGTRVLPSEFQRPKEITDGDNSRETD